MADALWNGRSFRTFNVLEEFSREVLRIKVDTSLPAARVVRALDELLAVSCQITVHTKFLTPSLLYGC